MNFYRWLNQRHTQQQLRKIDRVIDDPVVFPAMTWQEELEHMEVVWAARPWYRKAYDKMYYKLFGMHGLFPYQLNPRVIMNRMVWRHQRAKRGWSDSDSWSADSYIAKVISGMLSYMADHTHSYPGQVPWDTPEKWEAHLRDISERLQAWNNDTWTDNDAFETAKAAMKDAMNTFAENFGWYWD